jgi:hypothetical protein
MVRCADDGVMTMKPDTKQMELQGSPQSGMPGFNSETQGRFCDGLGSNNVVQYFVGPINTLHSQITAREYVGRLDNKVHPMIQTLYLNDAPIYTAGTVQSQLQEHEELQHNHQI